MDRQVTDQLLPITMVGSYPRPLWYRHQLAGRDLWEAIKLEEHAQAYEDAVAAVIGDQELAGLDVVSDGQMHFDDYGGSIGSFTWYWYERLAGSTGEAAQPDRRGGGRRRRRHPEQLGRGARQREGRAGADPARRDVPDRRRHGAGRSRSASARARSTSTSTSTTRTRARRTATRARCRRT